MKQGKEVNRGRCVGDGRRVSGLLRQRERRLNREGKVTGRKWDGPSERQEQVEKNEEVRRL